MTPKEAKKAMETLADHAKDADSDIKLLVALVNWVSSEVLRLRKPNTD